VIGTTDGWTSTTRATFSVNSWISFSCRRDLDWHRFTKPMVTHASAIQLDERVQIVMHMDGISVSRSPSANHCGVYREGASAVGGLKLFYKNDRPCYTERSAQVASSPVVISYQ